MAAVDMHHAPDADAMPSADSVGTMRNFGMSSGELTPLPICDVKDCGTSQFPGVTDAWSDLASLRSDTVLFV